MRVFLTDDDLDVNISSGPRFVIRGTRGHADMPRRTRSNAVDVIRANRNARWRYLLRSLDFQRDVNLIRDGALSRSYAGDREARRIARRWLVRGVWIPTDFSTWQKMPAMNGATMRAYEALLADDESGWGVDEDFTADDPYAFEDDDDSASMPGSPGRFRRIYVRLDAPLDVLMALIEKDLREVKAHSGGVSRRWRADKTDFYLTVYDQAVAGKSFRDIARALDRPVSTVKTAFLVACGHIYGMASPRVLSVLETSANSNAAKPSRSGSVGTFPSKSSLPIVSLDPGTHMQTCATCLRASKPERLCSQARAYINQDARSKLQAS